MTKQILEYNNTSDYLQVKIKLTGSEDYIVSTSSADKLVEAINNVVTSSWESIDVSVVYNEGPNE